MTAYFAYGANMDPVHMAEHCPEAERVGLAVLPEFRIGIGAAGFATARPAPGAAIHGVLWRLTDADEAALDRFEDVNGGFYRKDAVPVVPAGRPGTTAMIYRAVDDRPGAPNQDYLARVIEVAETSGLPAGYLDELHRLRGR